MLEQIKEMGPHFLYTGDVESDNQYTFDLSGVLMVTGRQPWVSVGPIGDGLGRAPWFKCASGYIPSCQACCFDTSKCRAQCCNKSLIGMSHIFDNITKDILHALPGFGDFQQSLRTLCDLLSVDHYRSRLPWLRAGCGSWVQLSGGWVAGLHTQCFCQGKVSTSFHHLS